MPLLIFVGVAIASHLHFFYLKYFPHHISHHIPFSRIFHLHFSLRLFHHDFLEVAARVNEGDKADCNTGQGYCT